ncbi:MAG: HEAT repeat domain-containing protein [Albidovulum sp.]
MAKSASAKGRKVTDLDPGVLAQLNAGQVESRTLTDGLAVDFAVLMAAAFPFAGEDIAGRMDAAKGMGITQRMAIAAGLLAGVKDAGLAAQQSHPSDTIRGWACYTVSQMNDLSLQARLGAIRPLADDHHFGVREWAWLALRPHLASQPQAAVALLAAWTTEPSEFLRRYACEAIRPRGVWCKHIAAFQEEPALGLPVLEPLRSDPARYVQDSVANWLNDAAKSQPDWVRGLCDRWLMESPTKATAYICKRAQRSL